jgi:ABC-2 type transport system permease protein
MKAFVALLRRECWEHRSLIVVPLVLGALVLAGSLYGIVRAIMAGWPLAGHGDLADAMTHPHAANAFPALYFGLTTAFGVILAFVLTNYFADSLYADRRDRSILFWKSLPVSDVSTVLSKLATGLVVAPALALAVALLTTLLLALIGTAVLAVAGVEGTGTMWNPGQLLRGLVGVPLAALLVLLWYAPVAGWILLASAWAPRAPLLWATLPPVALMIAERATFGSNGFARFVGDRLGGVYSRVFDPSGFRGVGVQDGEVVATTPMFRDVGAYLTSLDLWGGLLVGAVFVAGAIALRRYRDET